MGRHPGQRDLSEEDWQKELLKAIDPDSIGLMLDYNLYASNEDVELIRWGVSWRPKWKPYTSLAEFTSEHGLERHGEVAIPGFVSRQDRDFRLMPDSPVIEDDGYIRCGMRNPASGMTQIVMSDDAQEQK